MTDPLIDKVIANRYKILDILGRGGMGVVYLAYDRELDEEIALKTLPREFAYDTRAINDMRSEVKVARGLSHHNIVRVHDLGKDGDLVFITMEYVVGKMLKYKECPNCYKKILLYLKIVISMVVYFNVHYLICFVRICCVNKFILSYIQEIIERLIYV